MTSERTRGTSRVRLRFRRFAIRVLVVLLPIAAWTMWDYVEARRLARLVDEIRAKGEPVSIVRMYNALPGAEQAVRYYDAAAALVDGRGLYDATGLFRRLDYPRGEDVATLMQDIRAWLEKNREAEELLGRVPAVEFGAYPPGTVDYSRQLDRLLRLASLADLRALDRVHAKDPDAATRAVLQQLQIARLLGAQTTDLGVLTAGQAIGRAVSVIPQILELGPSSELLTSLHDAIALEDRDGLIEQSILGERAFVLGRYWDSSRRWFAAPGTAGMAISDPVWLSVRPYAIHLVIGQVQMMNKFLETSRKPWPDRLAFDAPDIPEVPPQRRGPLYFVTAPHLRWVTVNAQRTRTTYAATMLGGVRSTVAVIAIERYRRSHAGALPSSLAELVPDRLPEVLVDPYSGRALKYKILPDGFVVYSVGANRTDDGAQGAGTQLRRRWGANQLNEQPLDIGVKVRLQKGAANETFNTDSELHALGSAIVRTAAVPSRPR